MKSLPFFVILVIASVQFTQAQTKIACIGNSITQGSGLTNPATQAYPAQLQTLLGTTSYTVENDGVSGTTMLKNGDNSYWVNGKLANVFTFKPNIVTIKLGTNDTKPQNWDPHYTEFKRDYLAMIDTLNTLSTKPRIFLVLPVPIWTNTMGIRDSALQKIMVIINQIANERGLPVIDCNTPLKPFQAYFSDGVHPNVAGADSIAHIIYRSITGSPAVRFRFRSVTTSDGTLPYRLFIPENYSTQQKYPLILTLHGAGERGTDNIAQVAVHRLAETWAEDSTQKKQKAFVASPQCPATGQWVNVAAWNQMFYSTTTMAQSAPLTIALKMVDSLIKEFPIDTNRLYVTGISMGGYGTWDIITRHPQKFAAAIPQSGGCDTGKATAVKNVPIWSFHGDIDPTVPPQADDSMMKKIKSIGDSVVQYTTLYTNYFSTSTITRTALSAKIDSGAAKLYCEYSDGSHDIWENSYNDPLLAKWLFLQHKTMAVGISREPAKLMKATSGQSIMPVMPGADLSSVLCRLVAPSGSYELCIFDAKGEILLRAAYAGGTIHSFSSTKSLVKSAPGIRWVMMRPVK